MTETYRPKVNKESSSGRFCAFCKFFKNAFFSEQLRTTSTDCGLLVTEADARGFLLNRSS